MDAREMLDRLLASPESFGTDERKEMIEIAKVLALQAIAEALRDVYVTHTPA
jgi:hypothetical protein